MADPSQPNGSEQPSTPAETADSAIKPEPDLDPSIDQDIEMNADGTAQGANADEAVDPIAAAPTPSKKETSLREFLSKMDDYAPIVRPSLYSLFRFSSYRHPIPSNASESHMNSEREDR